MLIGEAREAARDWVRTNAAAQPWFAGAYFGGSTVGLPEGAEVPRGSDIDVMVVTTDPQPPTKPGKFLHRGALVEISLVPHAELASPEAVLADYHLAGPFRADPPPADTLIADPTGHLTRLRRAVAGRFAEPAWVRTRYEHALARARNGLTHVAETAPDLAPPSPAAVLGWLFPTGVTTHVLLVAGLRNPTVRLRYLRTRELLAERGLPDAYPPLLAALGCATLTAERAEAHLATLAEAFDAAAPLAAATPFPFRSDVQAPARPVAIDASRELIRAGRHREVLFWLVATQARCQLVLAEAGTEEQRRAHAGGFAALLADLGLGTAADLAERARRTLGTLPALTATAEELLAGSTRGAPSTAG
ncbi:hypothetical protein FH609_003175 [Streptomyces sp. 3MP-14]|uniref:Uncharacterized protein n=1 Tax=Streptomyces mimosae TaxID=2586635 RepID=A0A5N5ZYZ9_9ACTN|nr:MULTISPECIES: hypothetical protein [Streptomyces]KAB8161162.1 hypothetical protein FH607_026345 [Streptomyces mimosae]KAB8178973.1 hypothetical protein FH609_003175 [Streptomyces sp. 3MP-14]